MKDRLTHTELQRYERIQMYTNNFRIEELEKYENDIFGSLDKKERARIEYRRLKELLRSDSGKYAKYLNEIIELEKLFNVLNFDFTAVDEMYKKIVSIQLDLGQTVRLFSILTKLKEELDYIDFSRRFSKNTSEIIKR